MALRTTLLVGHPGETDENFNELIEFVRFAKFDRLDTHCTGHAPYSTNKRLLTALKERSRPSRRARKHLLPELPRLAGRAFQF